MRILLIVFALMVSVSASFPAYGGELDDLKAAVRQLQQRIEDLEKRQKAEAPQPAPTQVAQPEQTPVAQPDQVAVAGQPVTAGALPGSFRIPGTNSSLKIYGNVRVDSTYDFASRNNDIRNNDWASAVFVQPLETNSANRSRDGQFYLTARASRLGILTSTPTPLSTLDMNLEADFNAPNDYMGELGSNSTQFRLRQAWVRMGRLLAGQTWSNYIDLRSYPETVDFNPPGDVTLIRQAQLRYTQPLGASSLSLSVENPESVSQLPPSQTLSNGGRNDFDRIPDLTANWTWNGKNAHLSARAATMEYRNDFHSKRGYALGLSGSGKIGSGTLVAGVQGGEGIGRYMLNSVLQGATETGTDLRLWNAWGWHVGYTQPWTASLRSNFIFGQTLFGADAAANDFLRKAWIGREDTFVPNRRVDQAFVNLFWEVFKNMEVGIEYAWGKRITFGDEEGTQQRINATAIYNFP